MPAPTPKSRGVKAVLRSHEFILFVVVVLEWIFFYFAGTSKNFSGATVGFGTLDAQYDIFRHGCEIGLLALVMTPIILTGGIDLSVGSALGLSAIVFGKLWHDAGWPIPAAIAGALISGGLGGGLNALLITWLRLPPLIVTLGTYSLFRGLAEALTHGVVTYTNFPDSFLFWGNERILGMPAQLPIFIFVAIGVWLLVHRMTFGRSFRAIGYSPEGSRYAGLPVNRRLAFVYILAGVVSALAGIIFTARLGQAKADLGTGYELFAITAVVLGGTSIFGGSGSVHGTLLGTAAVAILTDGLSLAHWPREAGGMLTGILLILALTASALPKILSRRRSSGQTPSSTPQPTPSPSS
jgi:ribose/xylose/arabinose/galactoside ABC-type transport system permease subunit